MSFATAAAAGDDGGLSFAAAAAGGGGFTVLYCRRLANKRVGSFSSGADTRGRTGFYFFIVAFWPLRASTGLPRQAATMHLDDRPPARVAEADATPTGEPPHTQRVNPLRTGGKSDDTK